MVYAIAPVQEKQQVLWIDRVREPFLAPTILKSSVVGTEGELLKLDRITKPVDRSRVYEIDENKYRDIEKARTEFSDALEELERLIKNCQCIANHPNQSFVGSWAIALKHQPDRRVELEPWEVLTIRMGKIRSHSSEEVRLTDSEENKFRCSEPERVYVLKSLSDWRLIQSQIELCEKMGRQFKEALEQKLVQNVLDETRPSLTVIHGGKIEEFVQPVDVEVVESRPLRQDEQEFYGLLPSKTRNWLLNEIEPEHNKLLQEENQYRAVEFEFCQKATKVARQRGSLLLRVEEELSKIKVPTDNKYSKKNLYHLWLEIRYKDEMQCGSIKSAKQLALNDKKIARDPDFAKLPEEILNKFDRSAAVKLATEGNEHAKSEAIALAQDPEVKRIRHSLASKLIKKYNPDEPPKIDDQLIAERNTEETESKYPINDLKDAVRNAQSDEDIEMILDAIVNERLEKIKIESKKTYWEELAKKEAEDDVAQKLSERDEAIAKLAEAKSKNVQLQQRVEELETKLAQVDESKIVKENQDLHRKVDEYAIAHRAKQQVSTKYHFVEQTAQVLFNKGDQLNTFRELLAALKAAEEELLILKGASAAVEKSPQLEPDGDVMNAETLPEKITIGT